MILSERLQGLLDSSGEDRAIAALRRYFTPRPTGAFTGAHFERFAGGGDRPEVADHFTSDDLVAVSMLSVAIVGDAALNVLEVRRARIRALLQAIPPDRELADLDASELGPEWPVRALYRELISIPDIGETGATKLMARKRPHLVPILDSVVTAELSIERGRLWEPLHSWLTAHDRANNSHLMSLRERAGLGHDISLLRVFDVLTWMAGKGLA